MFLTVKGHKGILFLFYSGTLYFLYLHVYYNVLIYVYNVEYNIQYNIQIFICSSWNSIYFFVK